MIIVEIAKSIKERSVIEVLMLGWELPPYNSGGLGTACLGMTEALAAKGVKVKFVLPKVHGPFPYRHMDIYSAADYTSPEEIATLLKLSPADQLNISHSTGYGNRWPDRPDLLKRLIGGVGSVAVAPDQQAAWYAYQTRALAKTLSFDIIHSHDWLTLPSALAARQVAIERGQNIPVLAHIHAIEADRCAGPGDSRIEKIEAEGLRQVDQVIAVSHYTKATIHRQYGIEREKISVVHNGLPEEQRHSHFPPHPLHRKYKLVLSMGRLTRQKGPDYFLKLAEAVCKRDPEVRFLLIGSGDMEQICIEEVARRGLTGKVLFNPFVRGEEVDRAYQMADLFVMPSVSEPFGLVALEALRNGTPVIASKQSGVIEVYPNLIQADFWDIDLMTEQVLSLLHQPERRRQIRQEARTLLPTLSWKRAAEQLQELYSTFQFKYA